MVEARPSEQLLRRVLSAVWLAAACLLIAHADADVSGGDAGEIGGAAWTLGVAHPTGFPLDMLLLRLAACIPLGPLSFRQNLCASVLGACVVTSVAWLACLMCRRSGVVHGASCAIGALLAGAALLASRTFLAATLSVEVYATALLCVLGAIGLLAKPGQAQTRALWTWFGFALGTHVTAAYSLAPLLAARALSRPASLSSRLRQLRSAGVCAGLGALCLGYLPLASSRDGAFDWGDPETLASLWRHLSASRIREAYASVQWQLGDAPAVELFAQLAHQPVLLALAALGLAPALRRDRQAALSWLALFSLDLAYGVWINPMGIAELQVGHTAHALLAVAAGCGCAHALAFVRERSRAGFWLTGTAALAALGQLPLAPLSGDDEGHVLSERYGSGSPLVDLPARSVYVCESDDACANALFAIYAEGVRPDLAVVPAQHLWDPTVTRRLHGLHASAPTYAPPERRRELARAGVLALLREQTRRPVFFERLPSFVQVAPAFERAPFLGAEARATAVPGSEVPPLTRLERARFGDQGPRGPRARAVWSRAHELLGEAWVRAAHPKQAIAELSRALALSPGRAVTHSNLGVAFELEGEPDRALQETMRAVALDPQRATPWVNLARLTLKLRGPDAAREILAEAQRRALTDERLVTLARALEAGESD